MKKVSVRCARLLLTLLLLAPIGTNLKANSFAKKEVATSGVTQDDVLRYLQSKGYQVIDLKEDTVTLNWYSHTILNGVHLYTTVYVKDGQIVGNSDIVV